MGSQVMLDPPSSEEHSTWFGEATPLDKNVLNQKTDHKENLLDEAKMPRVIFRRSKVEARDRSNIKGREQASSLPSVGTNSSVGAKPRDGAKVIVKIKKRGGEGMFEKDRSSLGDRLLQMGDSYGDRARVSEIEGAR